MKKRPLMFLIALILTVVGAVASLAEDDAEVRKELEVQYKKLAEAHDRKDLRTIASLKTLDFHAIFPDGKVDDVKQMEQYTRQFVDTSVIQRETWVKTLEGWKLKSVDNVRDQKRFVDGKRVDPTKPYDPNAPPYNPHDTGARKQ